MNQLENYSSQPNQMGSVPPIDPRWIEYQREMALIEARTRADITKAQVRSEIDLQEAVRLLRLREDVKMEAACLTDGFVLSEDGNVCREQRFLLRPKAEHKSGNFQIVGRPRLLTAEGIREKLLLVRLRVGETEGTVTIDLRNGSSNYVARKFHEIGAHLFLRRGERNDVYLCLVEFLCEKAEGVRVPRHRGFNFIDDELVYIEKK